MKVITGRYRAKRLLAPEGMTTRPTLQRAKETMFNSACQFFDGGNGLDVFSGSGQLGIEGLSRGLDFCVFNEIDSKSKHTLMQNLATIEKGTFTVYSLDYKDLIRNVKDKKFNAIFIDPPYPIAKESLDFLIKYIDDHDMLAEDGVITGEIPSTESLLEDGLNNIYLSKIKNFSKLTNIFTYRKK